MEPTMKTTVYLDAADYRRLKRLAAAEGRPAAELIRTAVGEYVRAHATRGRPASLGAGRSGDGTLSERTEELLEGFGEDS
jgi:predicted transcriptional regulator